MKFARAQPAHTHLFLPRQMRYPSSFLLTPCQHSHSISFPALRFLHNFATSLFGIHAHTNAGSGLTLTLANPLRLPPFLLPLRFTASTHLFLSAGKFKSSTLPNSRGTFSLFKALNYAFITRINLFYSFIIDPNDKRIDKRNYIVSDYKMSNCYRVRDSGRRLVYSRRGIFQPEITFPVSASLTMQWGGKPGSVRLSRGSRNNTHEQSIAGRNANAH